MGKIPATNQLSIFDTTNCEIPKQGKNDTFDDIMSQLDQLNKMGDAMNELLTGMINDLQKDMDEDTKMMINNPKEYYRLQKLKNTEEIQNQKETEMANELTCEAIETLKNSTIEGMIVKLPEGQLDRKIYVEVKNKLELIGGKWKGGKISGFVFNEDPTELLQQIASGEKRNLKKEFQFFATPDHLADQLVELAEIEAGMEILEPSAGQGAIIKAIHRQLFDSYTVWAFEMMPVNQTFLNKIVGCRVLGSDFLTECDTSFDRIIANPPFAKNQDITHVRKMFDQLKPGGRLVSIMSKHWQWASNKKEVEFRKWLEDNNAEIHEIDAGEFKESGTSIATCIVVIDKD